MEITVRNKKWDEERFLRERKEVLSMWPTGKEVDFDDAVAYHKSLPDHKNFTKVMQRLHREGETAIFPRVGTPILEQEIELNKALVEAGLPVIPLTPDSYCRLGQFAKAQKGLEESNRTGQPKLNGYPTVIHGVKNTRKVVESTEAALNQRMTNLGGVKLMAEIAFASGLTAALVDPIITFGWYEKKATAAECIEEYQYIQRLIGCYADRGVIIATDIDGINSNLQFPMSVDIAGIIILLAMAFYIYRRLTYLVSLLNIVAFSLILAGTVGNLIDRIRLEHVTDFIDIGVWPVFNVADSAITVGVIVLVFSLIRLTIAEGRRST